MLYAKIERVTSTIIARQQMDSPERALNKPHVWLPYVDPGKPAYDPLANDLSRAEQIPDLSDLAVDVSPDASAYVAYTVTPLTQQEIDDRAEAEAAARFDDTKMLKAVAIWTAQQLTIPLAQARDEIKAIYKGL